jgi:hypothetical protein
VGRQAFLVGAATVVAAVLVATASAFDRQPVPVGGLTPDSWGQSTTKAQTALEGRYPGITVVYCAGALIAGDSSASWVHGLTRYWDKLVCAGYTATTGKTIFTLIFDAKGVRSWIIYRLKNVSVTALQTP